MTRVEMTRAEIIEGLRILKGELFPWRICYIGGRYISTVDILQAAIDELEGMEVELNHDVLRIGG